MAFIEPMHRNKPNITYLLTYSLHEDIIKRKHFPHYWPFVRVIHWSPVNSPQKKPVTPSFDVFFICTWINCWVKNCEAGDMRRHCAHYDVILLWLCPSKLCLPLELSFLYLFKCFYIWQRIMKINHESVWDLNLIITNLYMDITRHRRAPNCGITAGSSHKRALCPLWNFQLGLAPIWSYGIFFLQFFFFFFGGGGGRQVGPNDCYQLIFNFKPWPRALASYKFSKTHI